MEEITDEFLAFDMESMDAEFSRGIDVGFGVVDEEGFLGFETLLVEDELKEERVGFAEMRVEREVGFVEEIVELGVAEAELEVAHIEVVVDLVGVAHEEDAVMLFDFLDGADAFDGNVEEHGVPYIIEGGVRHTGEAEEFLDTLAEGSGREDAAVEAFEEGLELGAMEEIEVSEAFLLEFVKGHFFVDVEDDAAEVEDDISDFFAHFKKKVVLLQINSGPIAQLVRATDS